MTASQRSRTSVSSRTLRRGWSWPKPKAEHGASLAGRGLGVKSARCKPRNGRGACASCRAGVTSGGHGSPPTPPPSPSTAWSSATRPTTAVDGISFPLAPGSITGLLGGNGAGKTTTIAMIMGLVTPTAGTRQRARRRHAARALPRAAPDEFREPLCRHADAAHGAAEPRRCSRSSTRCRTSPARIAELAGRARSRRIPRPADRQALGRAEDPRLARQGADQRAGAAAARRADRLARSRHRRLGARRGSSATARDNAAPPCCSPRTT